MQEVELVIIINSYNRLELLKQSLHSLVTELKKTRLAFAVVLFDAGSTDDSIQWIENFALNNPVIIKLIKAYGTEDASFSYGVNNACQFAIENFTSLKYFLLYETDNYVKSAAPLVKAVDLLKGNTEMAACGFTVRKHNGKEAGIGCPFPSLFSFALGKQFSHFLKLDRPRLKWISQSSDIYSFCDVVYTSPLVIKRDIWQKLHGFDYKCFPFSDCDIDLAFRIHRMGNKMAVLQTSDIIHDNLHQVSSWADTRILREHRARFIYFKKHYGNLVHLVKPFLCISHIIEFNLLLVFVLLGKRPLRSLKIRGLLLKKIFFNYS